MDTKNHATRPTFRNHAMPHKISACADIIQSGLGEISLPVSNKAIKSKFFSYVKSEENLYFLDPQNHCNSRKFLSSWLMFI